MSTSVAIIGGGPAGLCAAIRAAERGLKTVLYEKGKTGSSIKCAEGFVDTLGTLGRPEAGVLFKVNRIIFAADREVSVNLGSNHGLWMMDRSAWQESLARRALALGVSVEENSPITKHRLLDLLDSHRYIIDASGAPSVTSKAYGFVPVYLKNATILAQYVVEGDFGYLGKNTIKAAYEPQYIGYYYVFPKGENSANVGIGKFNIGQKGRPPHLQRELDRIMRKEGLNDHRIHRRIAGFTPSTRVPMLIRDKILLAGDAAALCSPLHGGGMDMACISGRLAAELIAAHRVSEYPSKLWQTVGRKLTMEKRACTLWHLLGHRFVLGALKFPRLTTAALFCKHPLPQILGFGGKRLF